MTPGVGKTRILVVALGSTGDVNPMLGIASTLRRRGHDVVFFANPVFERFATALGVPFSPVGTERDYEFIWDRKTWQWWRCMDPAFRKGWLPHLRPVYEGIASHAGTSRTVIVANIVAAGAQLAQEKLGMPLAMVTPSSVVFQSLDEFPDYGPFQRAPRWLGRPSRRLFYRLADAFVDFWIAKGFNELRSEIGLPTARRFFSRWIAGGDRIIGLWPEWFARQQRGWPPQLILTGFPNYDRGELDGNGESTAVGDDEAEPPIVFTCGSAMTHAGAFLKVAAEAGKILGRRALVVTDTPIELPAHLSELVECRSYIPFQRLLPKAAAVVHHGGIGTTAAALAAGIPQVIVPLAFDQFDNAERCERLGLARKVSRQRFRPRRIAKVIRKLLGSREVAERCRHWQARTTYGEALVLACETVEDLLPREDR